MKILFLNPPFPLTVQKDQYCSLTSKTDYYWVPGDLLLQTAAFRGSKDYETFVIDGIVEKLSDEECDRRVDAFSPDAIICLTSIITLHRDLGLLERYKKAHGCRIIALGDIAYFKPETVLQSEWIDAVALQFPAQGMLDYLAGHEHPVDISYKKDGGVVPGERAKGPIRYGIPDHQKFPLKKYAMPLQEKSPAIPVLSLMSCPMGCSYCPVSDVPYRPRDLEELFAELDEIHSLGVREIIVGDLMFNADLKRAKAICRRMIERNYGFGWYCLMRPDRCDDEILELARQAGCHTIMFGVESTSETLLTQNQRHMSLAKVEATFQTCARLGIKSMGIIILGLPGETTESAQATIDFICAQPCDLLSVNIFSPRLGSRYMPKFGSLREVLADLTHMDSTRTDQSHCDLSIEELRALRTQALRKFYLSPRRMIRYARKMHTLFSLRQSLESGFRLLTGY